MTLPRTLVLWITLLALAPVSVEAARGRHCRRLCQPFITACVQAHDCAAQPAGHARRSCKRSCKHQLLHSCKLDSNACSTTTTTTLSPGPTTTTLPESCPGLTSVNCTASSDLTAFGSGGAVEGARACVEEQGELPRDSSLNVTVSVTAEDTPPGISVNVLGSGGADYEVVCSGQRTTSPGSVTVEQTGGSPYGLAGCCGDAGQSQLLHCRVTIVRMCLVNEKILGDFELDAECNDGTTCSREIRFLAPRDS